jgi:hypothetical protein
MNRYRISSWLLILITSNIFCGCANTPAERYKALERAELESGVRYDSLFKGFYFGMKHDKFRAYCYYKNTVEHDFKMQGPNLTWLESEIKEMSYPAAINFYPVFKEGVITEMDALIYYKNAVFKDRIFEKDSLLLDVLGLMKKWYGKEFIKIESPDSYREDIYVSVHGNRRITVYPTINRSQEIKVWMVDLYAKEKEAEK